MKSFERVIFSFMILFPQRSPSECPVTLQDMECSWGWRAVVRPKHTLNFVLCNLAITLVVFFTFYIHYTWSAIWTFHFSCMTLLVYAETLVHGTLFCPGNFFVQENVWCIALYSRNFFVCVTILCWTLILSNFILSNSVQRGSEPASIESRVLIGCSL